MKTKCRWRTSKTTNSELRQPSFASGWGPNTFHASRLWWVSSGKKRWSGLASQLSQAAAEAHRRARYWQVASLIVAEHPSSSETVEPASSKTLGTPKKRRRSGAGAAADCQAEPSPVTALSALHNLAANTLVSFEAWLLYVPEEARDVAARGPRKSSPAQAVSVATVLLGDATAAISLSAQCARKGRWSPSRSHTSARSADILPAGQERPRGGKHMRNRLPSWTCRRCKAAAGQP